MLAWIWAVTPALALVSSTGYIRVVPQTAQLAYLGANRAAFISTISTAAAATSPASLGLRLVAGPVGWAALGVTAGLVMAQWYYSAAQLQQVKTNAAPQGMYTVNTGTGPLVFPGPTGTQINSTYPEAQVQVNVNGYCDGADTTFTHDWSVGPFRDVTIFFYQGPDLRGGAIVMIPPAIGKASYYFCHRTGQPGSISAVSPSATSTDIVTYVNGLPATDPLSVESH
ncbi:MAG TPA: hypothetical protein VJ746_06650, partial [Nitrospira sp.]|nr:hypothetical protein [Nitrospira sp.]